MKIQNEIYEKLKDIFEGEKKERRERNKYCLMGLFFYLPQDSIPSPL